MGPWKSCQKQLVCKGLKSSVWLNKQKPQENRNSKTRQSSREGSWSLMEGMGDNDFLWTQDNPGTRTSLESESLQDLLYHSLSMVLFSCIPALECSRYACCGLTCCKPQFLMWTEHLYSHLNEPGQCDRRSMSRALASWQGFREATPSMSPGLSLWNITIGLSQPCAQAIPKCRLLMERCTIIVRSKLLIPKRKVLFWRHMVAREGC